MPITTFYGPEELYVLAPKDKEVSDLLNEVNNSGPKTFFVTEREVTKRRWFKTERDKVYELLARLSGNEYQVMNFPRDWEWTINTMVPKSYILTYLYGYLGRPDAQKRGE